eukprot:2397994-Pyramimonas_sp.AAC.1
MKSQPQAGTSSASDLQGGLRREPPVYGPRTSCSSLLATLGLTLVGVSGGRLICEQIARKSPVSYTHLTLPTILLV